MEATGSAEVPGATAAVVIVGAAGLTAGVAIGVTASVVVVGAAGLTAGVMIGVTAEVVVVVVVVVVERRSPSSSLVGVAGSDGAATGTVGAWDASGWVEAVGGVETGGDTADMASDTADSGVWDVPETRRWRGP